jgi:hypothetical protein
VERPDRSAANKRLYREVNARIRAVAETDVAGEPLEFLCECGSPACTATLELPLAVFDEVTGAPGRIILSSEHRPSIEESAILAQHDGYLIVSDHA